MLHRGEVAMCTSSNSIYTIGYSGYHQNLVGFASDLVAHGISVVADVRTSPYSKYAAEFNRESLEAFLHTRGIKYVFMGNELGARPSDRTCYVNGSVNYDKIQESSFFQNGLQRLQDGLAKGFVIAILCAEKDPICCHRNILVAHALAKRGVEIKHLIQLAPGESAVVEESSDTESRLFEECDMDQLSQGDLFMSDDERIERAYRARFKEIAYREENDNEQ